MSQKQFNVGVIGYGLSAKVFHIPLFSAVPAFKFHAIVQRNPKPNDDASKDFPEIKAYRSTDALFADKDVDVVIVTTTPATHYDLTKQALEAGKHVVVEKPFVPTSSEARELSALAKEKSKLLAVYQNRRWDADFLTLSSLLKKGSLGRVVEFETHFDRHRPSADTSGSWKTHPAPGSGVVYDLGTHLMDQVVHTYGVPQRITGIVAQQREGAQVDDTATILLHYNKAGPEGMPLMATVKAAVVSAEVEQLRFWVRGTKGSFKKFGLDVQEGQLRKGMKPWQEGFGVESESSHGTLTEWDGKDVKSRTVETVKPETYTRYYELLAEALQGKGSVPVSADEAADVIKLVELAKQSSDEGRTLDV